MRKHLLFSLNHLSSAGKKLFCFLTAVFIFHCFSPVSAQVVKTENFDATQFPPLGWYSGKFGAGSDVDNYWERATNDGGMEPSGLVPQGGAGMARYRSDVTTAGEAAFLASARYDLSLNPGTATVSFRMYRDNSNTLLDSLVVYANTAPNITSGNEVRLGMIPRYSAAAPAGTPNSWQGAPYSFLLPSTGIFLSTSVYVVFVGYSRFGANIYIDEFSIQTYPVQQTFVSAGLDYQETSDVGKGTVNQHIVTLKIIANGGLDPLRIDSLTFNPVGTTSMSDIQNAKVWYTRGTNAFITSAGNQLGGTITIPSFINLKFIPIAAFYLENGDNYFWLTYDVPAGATSANWVDADLANAFGAGNGVYYTDIAPVTTSYAPAVSPQTLAGARQIDVAYCNGIIPVYWVGTSWLNGSYTNNDYVAEVDLIGEPGYPIIDNPWNNNGPYMPTIPTPFAAHPPDYEQFSQPGTVLTPGNKITTALKHGNSYSISLKVGTWFTSNCINAWIDYNKDGDWLDIVGSQNERLSGAALATCPPGSGTATYNFTVPATGSPGLITGNTRMRVREVWVTPGMDPCQSGYTYGEVEDYTIAIIPTCSNLYKLWLGYTDDWNTPNNWCGGVPTINDVAVVDYAISNTPSYYRPVIHAGTAATAKTIRIGPLDTLWINAPNTSSLTVADSLSISYRPPGTGSLRVISAFNDTAQIKNGTTVRTLIMPFRGGIREQRLQTIYSKAEMLANGLQPGDVIDEIRFHFSNRVGANIYQNYTISYYWTNISCYAAGPATPAPQTAAGGTVFIGNIQPSTQIPGTQGTYTVTLFPNTFIWNPPASPNDYLVLQLCWDNASTPGVGDQQFCTQTAGCMSTIYFYHTTTSVPGACGLLSSTAGASSGMYDFRPNMTFKFHRPYNKYPIYIGDGPAYGKGDWVNNGSFVANYSRVTFRGDSIVDQTIAGSNPTTFYDLEINKTVANVRQDRAVTVNDTMVLTNGPFLLNGLTLTMNPVPLAAPLPQTFINPGNFTRPVGGGYLVSEDPASLGRVQWNINAGAAGTYIIPFGYSGNYVPFELIKVLATNVGNLTVSTYGTGMPNTPYPPAITHVNNASGAPNDGSVTVDRFWVLNRTNNTGNVDVAFNHTIVEKSTGGLVPTDNLNAQRWLPAATGWEFPGIMTAVTSTRAQANGLGANFSATWALTIQSNPLPIELFDFNAQLIKNKVRIFWSTASEIDNDYFIVERSCDLKEYDFISQVDSRGPSTSVLKYETFDNNPVPGVNYYKLISVDYDGSRDEFGPVAVNYHVSAFDITTAFHPEGEPGVMQVDFVSSSDEPVLVRIMDVNGKEVFKTVYSTQSGMNSIRIEKKFTPGAYFIRIENSTDKSTRTVFY